MRIFQNQHLRFLIYWLVSGGCEWPFWEIFLSRPPYYIDNHFIEAMLYHILGTSLLFVSMPRELGWFHYKRRWPRTFAIMMGFFPGLGWLGSGMLYLSHITYKKKSLEEEDHPWEYLFKKDLRHIKPQQATERIIDELDIAPIADIMAGDDLNLKRGAIERLVELKIPEGINLLMRYRSDDQMEVRFFVTSALTRIKADFEEQLTVAKKRVQLDIKNMKERLYLAQIYLDYAASSLLDEATKSEYKREALFHLEEVILSGIDDRHAYDLLHDVYIELKCFAKNSDLINLMKEKCYLDEASYLKKIIENEFYKGNYESVFKTLQNIDRSKISDNELINIGNWWGAWNNNQLSNH